MSLFRVRKVVMTLVLINWSPLLLPGEKYSAHLRSFAPTVQLLKGAANGASLNFQDPLSPSRLQGVLTLDMTSIPSAAAAKISQTPRFTYHCLPSRGVLMLTTKGWSTTTAGFPFLSAKILNSE